MSFKARLEREWRFVRGLNRTLKRVKTIAPASPNLICDDLQAADRHDIPAVGFAIGLAPFVVDLIHIAPGGRRRHGRR